jgi:hypothetical protein
MPKTAIDLRIRFKKETGEYPVNVMDIEGLGKEDNQALQELKHYIEWLEQVAITHLK